MDNKTIVQGVFIGRVVSMEILAIICAFTAFLILLWLAWIDLKLWILPNELVGIFAFLAIPFHFAFGLHYGDILFFVSGAFVGGGALFLIRLVANRIYGVDTLGIGDIKLMAAGGLWLGPEAVLMAMSAGAFAGVLHAVILLFHRRVIQGQTVSLNRMALPAGPGFIAGLLAVGLWLYQDLFL